MADVKISALTALGAAPAAADQLPIVDSSAGATKKVTIAELFTNPNVTGTVTADGLTVDGSGKISRDMTSGNWLVLDDTRPGYGDWAFYKTGLNNLVVGYDTSAGSGPVAAFSVNYGGDVSFYEDTGTTAKFFWDASAESLGIGTTSVRSGYSLDVRNASDSGINIQAGDASADIAFSVGSASTADKFVVTAGGNVGIGYASPASLLHLNIAGSSATSGGMRIGQNLLTSAYGYYELDTTNTKVKLGSSSASYPLAFEVASTEAMRIDSSGDLLVGTTALPTDDNTSLKFGVSSTGEVRVAVNNGNAAMFKRATTDGDIVEFRKDSFLVGSIGSYAGSELVIGTNETGLLFGDGSDNILPYDVGSTPDRRDAAISFGNSNYRFKDLYLSGGVYLGGTGAANLLDDYEEGTWTPTITLLSNLTGTATISHARYTKIGRIVHCSMAITGLSVTTSATDTALTFTLPTSALAFQSEIHGISGTVNFNSISSNGFINDATGGNNTTFAVLLPAELCGGSGSILTIAVGFTYEAA